jgi:cell division inhibitor SulA
MDVHPSSASSGVPPETGDPLQRLLEHPAIWRGRSVAHVEAFSTGFEALDRALPGHGWPRAGLIEILIARIGIGELYLLLPLLAALTRRPSARWCAWIEPPYEPYAPALAAHGVVLDRVFIARGESSEWAFEQTLISGACDVVLAWANDLHARDIRRLHLAAEKGRALGVLFRPRKVEDESSAAMLRMVVEPAEQGARVTLLKSRGGHRGSIDIGFQ